MGSAATTSELHSAVVAPYGQIWSGQTERDIAKLAREVDEYFALGLEIPDGGVVVDVGANVGMFAIAAASRAKGLHIVAVEPIPRFHAALERNFEANPHLRAGCASSTLLRVGLCDDDDAHEQVFAYFSRLPTDTTCHLETKRAEFEQVFAHHGATAANGIAASLPGSAGLSLAKFARRFVADIPRRGWSRWLLERAIGLEEIRCPMTTLAKVLDALGERPVDVLKIDVEGAELDVLRGVREAQWPAVRSIVLEGTDLDGRRLDEIRAFLARRGLTRHTLGEPEGAAAQGLGTFLLYAAR